MPDIQYPFELPPSLAAIPKKKGCELLKKNLRKSEETHENK